MEITIRENIIAKYSLHDMNVTAFDIQENKITMKLQYGMIKVSDPPVQVDGYVEFHDVDWDFCFVYLFDIIVNLGEFKGRKMMFRDFLEQYPEFGFSVVDEVYGYNQTKYWGWLTANETMAECIIEIYHAGDMIFVEET